MLLFTILVSCANSDDTNYSAYKSELIPSKDSAIIGIYWRKFNEPYHLRLIKKVDFRWVYSKDSNFYVSDYPYENPEYEPKMDTCLYRKNMYPNGLLYKKLNDSTLVHFVKLPEGLVDAMGKGFTKWIICRFHSDGSMVMEEWSGYNPKNEELEKENLESGRIIHVTGSGKFYLHPKSKEVKTR